MSSNSVTDPTLIRRLVGGHEQKSSRRANLVCKAPESGRSRGASKSEKCDYFALGNRPHDLARTRNEELRYWVEHRP